MSTPKEIAKRIKNAGLKKLKFYCQVCEKQCVDDNGYKCHLTTEAHLRRMALFAEDARGNLERYSRDFEREFVDILSRRYRTVQVEANAVYHELVADRTHTHMNSTRWQTLTAFCEHLHTTGVARVEQGARGPLLSYVDRDPAALARKRAREQERNVSEAEWEARQLRRQQARAREADAATQRLQQQRVAADTQQQAGGASGGGGGGGGGGGDSAGGSASDTPTSDVASSSSTSALSAPPPPITAAPLKLGALSAAAKPKAKAKVGGKVAFG